MTDDVTLLRQGGDSSRFGPERDVLFFDQPLRPERLAQVRTAQLWAAHDNKIARLPKVIGCWRSSRCG